MEIVLDACMGFLQRCFKRRPILKASLLALTFMVGWGLVFIEWSFGK